MTTVNVSVAAAGDDGQELAGTVYQQYHFAGVWRGDEVIGFNRFLNVTVPQGANVTSATFSVIGISNGYYPTYLKVRAHDADNSAQVGSSNLPSTWDMTTAGTDLDVADDVGWSGQTHNIDVTDVVQEVIDRSGWASGNALQILFRNDGELSGDYEINCAGYPGGAAALSITYSAENTWTYTPTGGAKFGGSPATALVKNWAYTASGGALFSGTAVTDYTAKVLLNAADITTLIFDDAEIEPGLTLRKTLRLILAALAGKVAGANSATITIRNAGDTKTRIVATVDEYGNRTAVSYDADE